MARPKPPEELFPTTIRFTRCQQRKISEMGHSALRQLVSEWRNPGESTVSKLRKLKARNEAIVADARPTAEVAKHFKLSSQTINHIKRKYK